LNALKNDKVNKSGDTMTGSLTAPTLHADDGVFDDGERVYSPNNPPPGGNDTFFVKILETDPVTERVKVQVLDANRNPTGEVIEGVRMVN
jgi:hypothetical protein